MDMERCGENCATRRENHDIQLGNDNVTNTTGIDWF